MPEKYGVSAELVKSIASTPVSTDTNLIFIGAAPCQSTDLNKPHLITSISEYYTKLGGAPGDGYNLTEAAIAAFTLAGVDKCYMIPVSNSLTFNAADYTGNAELLTGVYAIEDLLRNHPTTVNIFCAPSVTDSSVIAALDTIAKKADGHWSSFIIYDVAENVDQLNAANVAQPTAIISAKQLTDEYACAVWGHVKTSGGYIVSGAALRACLLAVSDADYGVPARCGGNLAINGIQGLYSFGVAKTLSSTAEIADDKPKVTITETDYTTYAGTAYVSLTVKADGVVKKTITDEPCTFAAGVCVIDYDTSTLDSPVTVELSAVTLNDFVPVTLKESDATTLSTDGICSILNIGGGNWRTWGDHTSAFTGGTISDERGRYDSNMRMLLMIMNRFQLKYRFSVDDPMTLTMRNDVLYEENDYLAYLKSIGAIVGDAACEFKAADNPVDNIAQGQFVWSLQATITPPLKYADLKVAYSQAGLSVYYE